MVDQIFKKRACLTQREIGAYLKKELSDSEQFAIENHLIDCDLCSDAVSGYAHDHSARSQESLQELQDYFSGDTTSRIVPLSTKSRSPKWQWLAIAASVLLVVAAGTFYWKADQSYRLFQKYYTSYVPESVAGTRAVGMAHDAAYEKAITSYIENDFSEAATRLRAYLKSNPDNFKAHYLLGMAYLETEAYELATIHFTLARYNSDLYYEDATWYLALANLAQEKGGYSLDLLEQLYPKVSPQYRDRVEGLRSDLKEMAGQTE